MELSALDGGEEKGGVRPWAAATRFDVLLLRLGALLLGIRPCSLFGMLVGGRRLLLMTPALELVILKTELLQSIAIRFVTNVHCYAIQGIPDGEGCSHAWIARLYSDGPCRRLDKAMSVLFEFFEACNNYLP